MEDGITVPGPVVANGALAVVVTLNESNELYREINEVTIELQMRKERETYEPHVPSADWSVLNTD